METTAELYHRINYPRSWLEEGKTYKKEDSYVMSCPTWHDPIPDIPEISVYELFKRSVDQHQKRTALLFLDNEITYEQFGRYVDQFASLLHDIGVCKGDIVCPMLPPCPQHWIVFFACAKIGAISAPINVMYKEMEVSSQINDCGARIVIALDVFVPMFQGLRATLGIEQIIATNIKDYASEDFKPYPALNAYWSHQAEDYDDVIDFATAMERQPISHIHTDINPNEDVVKIIYTSGTSGKSKGAMETHKNIVHNTITHAHLLPFDIPINYTFLPMNHTGGYMVFQLPTFHRGGMVIPRPMFDIEDAFRTIQESRVNTVFGPPTFYLALLTHPRFTQYDLGSLQFVCAGAAPVPEALMSAWKAKTGNILAAGWGMTETNSMGTWSMLKHKKNPLSEGVPYIGELKIVDDDGVVLPRGKVGEILYRGLQVSKGYFNNPEETARTFLSDGWMRTGDAGYVDEDDFLHYADRIKDLIIASGYNIAPAEVEAIIRQHPAVLEAAVVGWPSTYRGETVKAFVVVRANEKEFTEQDVIAFCRTRIAPFKVPTEVEFLTELPKNAMGKTLRRVLRDRNDAGAATDALPTSPNS